MIARRVAGDARGADQLGWLTLTALIVGCSTALVNRLLRHSEIDAVLARAVYFTDDIVGPIAVQESNQLDVVVDGLVVPDVGSRPGWTLAHLAGEAATGHTIVMDGFPLSSAAVRSAIAARITTSERKFH